jgi:hypothetical protein
VQEQILKYQLYAESKYKLLQWMIGFNSSVYHGDALESFG